MAHTQTIDFVWTIDGPRWLRMSERVREGIGTLCRVRVQDEYKRLFREPCDKDQIQISRRYDEEHGLVYVTATLVVK